MPASYQRETSFQAAMGFMGSLGSRIGESFREKVGPTDSGYRTGPRCRALIVGMDYKWAEGHWNIPVLNGGVSDAHRVARVLMEFYSFQSSEIRVVTDNHPVQGDHGRHASNSTGVLSATRETVLDGLKWLMEGARPGDSLVFYYAGHAASVFLPPQDRPTWAAEDQALAVLCLMNGMIFCHELWIEVQNLPPGCSVTMFIDAPFGHTMLNLPFRHPKDEAYTFANDPRRPLPGVRFLPPRDPTRAKNPQEIPRFAPPDVQAGVNAFVFCACGRDDMAREVPSFTSQNHEPGGLFTLALVDAMTRHAGTTATVLALYEDVQQRMAELCRAAGSRLPVNNSGQPQCPTISFMSQCLPEHTAFILPPRRAEDAGFQRFDRNPSTDVRELKGQISSLQGMVENLTSQLATMVGQKPQPSMPLSMPPSMPPSMPYVAASPRVVSRTASYPVMSTMPASYPVAPSYTTMATPVAAPMAIPQSMPYTNGYTDGYRSTLTTPVVSREAIAPPVLSRASPVYEDPVWPYEGGVMKLR